MKRTCESTHPADGTPCTTPAAFLVRIGTRKADEQWSCRRHLARVVVAMGEAESRDWQPVIVLWAPGGEITRKERS